MITKEEIKQIFRDIVRYWPDTGCSRLNTFFVIDDGQEFETNNLKAQYSDFVKGDFWARNWVISGADPSKLCKEYPILGIEQKRVTGKSLYDKVVCWEYWVMLADVPDCGDCFDCNRTIDEVDRDLFNNALIIAKQLLKYSKYEVTQNGETYTIWATQEQINYYLANNIITGYTDLCISIEMLLSGGTFETRTTSSEALDIRAVSLGNSDGARAVSFVLNFCDCVESLPGFDYDFRASAEIGVVKCPTCMPVSTVQPPTPEPLCNMYTLQSGGFNYVSFLYYDLIDNSPATFFADLINQGFSVQVRGRINGEQLIFDSGLPPFLNTLTEIEPGMGYEVQVNAGREVSFENCGYIVEQPEYKIDLVTGINFVWYVFEESQTVEQYFSALISSGCLDWIRYNEPGQPQLEYLASDPGYATLVNLEFGKMYSVRLTCNVSANNW